MPKRLLFICTGNICRSPMAEYLLRERLGSDSEWEVGSAGLAGGYGIPASQPGIEAMGELGIDMTGHASRGVGPEVIDWASVVVVMTDSHLQQMRSRFPGEAGKVFLLKAFDSKDPGGDIEDPIGAPVSTYRRIRDEIDAILPELMAFMDNLDVKTDEQDNG